MCQQSAKWYSVLRETSFTVLFLDFVLQEDEMNYLVPSSTGPERYHVSMDIGFCSCPEGISGQRCKHQVAVEKVFIL